MNKKAYQKPIAELVELSNEDIITASKNDPIQCAPNQKMNDDCLLSHQLDRCWFGWVECLSVGLFKPDIGDCKQAHLNQSCKAASQAGEWTGCDWGWSNWYSEP